MSRCEVFAEQLGDLTVVALDGELTLANAGDVGRQLEATFRPQTLAVVLDLGRLSFLDSAGIHLLFRVNRLIGSRAGRLHLVIPSEAPVHRIIRIVDPGGFIPLHGTRAEALAACAATQATSG